jgi:hypothetical protein
MVECNGVDLSGHLGFACDLPAAEPASTMAIPAAITRFNIRTILSESGPAISRSSSLGGCLGDEAEFPEVGRTVAHYDQEPMDSVQGSSSFRRSTSATCSA